MSTTPAPKERKKTEKRTVCCKLCVKDGKHPKESFYGHMKPEYIVQNSIIAFNIPSQSSSEHSVPELQRKEIQTKTTAITCLIHTQG